MTDSELLGIAIILGAGVVASITTGMARMLSIVICVTTGYLLFIHKQEMREKRK